LGLSFLISENTDAFIITWSKAKIKGRHLLARNAFSSIPAYVPGLGHLHNPGFLRRDAHNASDYGEQIIMKWLVTLLDST
jgi:hypothetical protein